MKSIKRDEFLQVNFSLQYLSFPPPPPNEIVTSKLYGKLDELLGGRGGEGGNLRWIVHSIQGK